MAEFETNLSFLDEAFDKLDQVDHDIAVWKGTSADRGTIEFAQREIDKLRLDERRQRAVGIVVDQAEGQNDAQLSEAHKFIVSDIVDHTWKPDAKESKRLIQESFAMYGRVRDNVERMRGIVAVVGEGSISLYESNGAEDITMERDGVAMQFKAGYSVTIENEKDKSFPDALPIKNNYSRILLPRHSGGYPADRMKPFDPASEKFRPHFDEPDYLGEPKQPSIYWLGKDGYHGERPTDTLSDMERYAFRLAQSNLLNASWLDLPAPGTALRERVAKEFARVYSDVLCGHKPWDIEPSLYTSYGSISGDTVSMRQIRERSLASYTTSERQSVFYASGTNADEIETVTRERITRLASSDNAMNVVGALHASRVMDAFFERMG